MAWQFVSLEFHTYVNALKVVHFLIRKFHLEKNDLLKQLIKCYSVCFYMYMKSGKNNGKPETLNLHENQVFQQLYEWFLSYRLEMNITYGSGEIIRNIITCITCTLLQLHVHVYRYSIFDKYMNFCFA